METKRSTTSFKTAWGKCADMFDICYENAMEANVKDFKSKTDSKELREWMTEARSQCAEMRNVTMAGLKMAIALSTTPGLKETFVNPETKPLEA